MIHKDLKYTLVINILRIMGFIQVGRVEQSDPHLILPKSNHPTKRFGTLISQLIIPKLYTLPGSHWPLGLCYFTSIFFVYFQTIALAATIKNIFYTFLISSAQFQDLAIPCGI